MGSVRERIIGLISFLTGVGVCLAGAYLTNHFSQRPLTRQEKLVSQLPAGFFGTRLLSVDGQQALTYRLIDGELFVFEIVHTNSKSNLQPTGRYNETRVFVQRVNQSGRPPADEFGRAPTPPCFRWDHFRFESPEVYSELSSYRREQIDFLIACTKELSIATYHAFRDN